MDRRHDHAKKLEGIPGCAHEGEAIYEEEFYRALFLYHHEAIPNVFDVWERANDDVRDCVLFHDLLLAILRDYEREVGFSISISFWSDEAKAIYDHEAVENGLEVVANGYHVFYEEENDEAKENGDLCLYLCLYRDHERHDL